MVIMCYLEISIHLYRGTMRDVARLKFSAFGAQVGHLAAQHRHGLRQVEAFALQKLDLLPFTKWMKSGVRNSGLADMRTRRLEAHVLKLLVASECGKACVVELRVHANELDVLRLQLALHSFNCFLYEFQK